MEEIDFTRMKPSEKYRLVKCPRCDRVGELHKYTNGSAGISHKGKIEHGFLSIYDQCFFKKMT